MRFGVIVHRSRDEKRRVEVVVGVLKGASSSRHSLCKNGRWLSAPISHLPTETASLMSGAVSQLCESSILKSCGFVVLEVSL